VCGDLFWELKEEAIENRGNQEEILCIELTDPKIKTPE
jgi:hypothetical protein